MGAARLPEVFDFEGLVVRCFPGAYATEFPQLPQSERRATPAVVRRLYKAAATHAAKDAECLICGGRAPIEGRVLIAAETDVGCICAACVWPDDARTASSTLRRLQGRGAVSKK
jgi:hypothetical protein